MVCDFWLIGRASFKLEGKRKCGSLLKKGAHHEIIHNLSGYSGFEPTIILMKSPREGGTARIIVPLLILHVA